MNVRCLAPLLVSAATCALALSSAACSGDSEAPLSSTPSSDAGADHADAADDAAPDSLEDTSADVAPDTSVDGPSDAPGDQEPACEPPADPTKASLCVRLAPETLSLLSDPQLDGQGIWLIQLYDTATLALPDGGEPEPIATTLLPEQEGGTNPPAMVGVYDDLGAIRFDGLPETVYARALFVDNLDALGAQQLAAGIWIGGFDSASGVFDSGELSPIHLTAGQGAEHTIPVMALRRLRLKLLRQNSLVPLGDGQGPGAFILFPTQDLGDGDGGSPVGFGYGVTFCGDLMASTGVDVEGVFTGAGPYYALGIVDDFGTGLDQGPGPGSILDLELQGGQPQLPAASKLNIPQGAYDLSATLELNVVIPFDAPQPPDTTSCPSPADAGTD